MCPYSLDGLWTTPYHLPGKRERDFPTYRFARSAFPTTILPFHAAGIFVRHFRRDRVTWLLSNWTTEVTKHGSCTATGALLHIVNNMHDPTGMKGWIFKGR